MRHKHADMIIEWAETGKQVQCQNLVGTWIDCHDNKTSWDEDTGYRFKPAQRYYRLYKFSCNGNPIVLSANAYSNEHKINVAEITEAQESFIGWMSDWVEVSND